MAVLAGVRAARCNEAGRVKTRSTASMKAKSSGPIRTRRKEAGALGLSGSTTGGGTASTMRSPSARNSAEAIMRRV